MVDIPEHLLLRSAEARAKALGISVEQALAEMKGETEPTVVSKEPEIEEAPAAEVKEEAPAAEVKDCLLYTSPSPRDRTRSRMPSSA